MPLNAKSKFWRLWGLAGLMMLPACSEPSSQLQMPQSPGKKIAASQAPLRQYLDIQAPFGGQLSPDGTFYYAERAGDTYQLFARPVDPDAVAEKITDFEDGISGFALAPDGRNIVVSASIGGDEQNDLYLMPTATREIEPLMVDRKVVYGSIRWKRDSSGFAFRANDESPRDFHVYTYDLASGSRALAYNSEGSNFPADFSRDGTKLIVGKYNSNTYQQVFEVDLVAGSSREVTPRGVQRQFDVVGYNADETHLIVSTDYLGNFTNLATLNIETGELAPLLPEFSRHDVDSANMNEDRSILAAVINEDGYGQLILRRMKDLSPIDAPRTGKGLFGELRFTEDTFLFSFHNARTPGTIFAWNLAETNKAPQALTVPDDAGVNLRSFVLPRLVHYESFDGMNIPAFLYVPDSFHKGRPCPFIVYFHGGPEAQARPTLSPVVQYFVSRGYGVIQPNVRGSSGYGTEFMNMDNYKSRMDSVRDGLAAAHWLIDQGYSESSELVAYGGSYGGFMVMATITEEPDLFGAACNVVGIVNFESFLENTKDYRRHLREAEYGPLSDPDFLQEISPIHKVDQIRTPLLVAHGRNDPRVPIGEAEQIIAALKERDRVVESVIFDDEGHGFRKQPNRIEFYESLVRFFDKHLKGAS